MHQLWKKQASVAYGYSLARLTLNYYMYVEAAEEDQKQTEIVRCEQQFHQALECYLQGADYLGPLTELRRSLKHEMETIVGFSDGFAIYEYVLNRVRPRFETKQPAGSDSDEALAERLLRFLTESENPAVMRRRLSAVISQLPVRFTRQKFYSIVREALAVCIETDQSGLEKIMYRLRTGAMLELDESRTGNYPRQREMLEQLRRLEFKTLTQQDYQKAVQIVKLSGEQLNRLTDSCRLLQDLVNDLYVLALTGSAAVKNSREGETSAAVLTGLLKRYRTGKDEDAETELLKLLYQLEGVQEHYWEKYLRLEGAPGYQAQEEPWAAKSRRVERLLSSSPFADLETTPPRTAGRELVEQETEVFIKQLDALFASCPKPVIRAVMAAVLAGLPSRFHSPEEIRTYIRGSLESCTDMAEKAGSRDLLEKIMESENDALVSSFISW